MWGKSIRGRRNSNYRGPGVEVCPEHLRAGKETMMARAEGLRRRKGQEDVRL